VDKTRKWLSWQRLLSGRKDCSTTNPENLATIGLVDFEIIGLTEIVKANIKLKNSSRTYSPRHADLLSAAGRAKQVCLSLSVGSQSKTLAAAALWRRQMSIDSR